MPSAVERAVVMAPCPYAVIDEIASGGMGTVYRARASASLDPGRVVALKRLHPHLARDPHVAAMFVEEARILEGLRHPNVVRVVDCGVDAVGPYIALDYVAGVSVADVMRVARAKRRLVPLGVVARVLAATADGLHAAHELKDANGELRHLVHRDVSPQNIMVSVDGEVVLIDFGVAKVRDAVAHTRTGVVKGKLAYMSPEQVSGKAIDHRTDVFALGVVLWELLTLHRLYRGETELETIQHVLNDPVEPVGGLRPDLPPALDALLFATLAKDPDQRIATAADFAAELRRITAKEPSDAHTVADYLASLMPDELATVYTGPPADMTVAAKPEVTVSRTRPRPMPVPVAAPPARGEPPRRAARVWLAAGLVAIVAVAVLIGLTPRRTTAARTIAQTLSARAQPLATPTPPAVTTLPEPTTTAQLESPDAAARAPARRAAAPTKRASGRRATQPTRAPRSGVPSLLSRDWQDE